MEVVIQYGWAMNDHYYIEFLIKVISVNGVIAPVPSQLSAVVTLTTA